ncbi:tape measure protein [Chitinophaga niabensis]|uniref:tape measure protein n=1 Tax=Chitinophaga niabensis TaxID=536979 RepID=UPI0031BA5DE4
MAVTINGGPLEFDAIIHGSQFKAQFDAIERQLKSLTVTAQRESNAIENVAKKAATAVGTYLSIAGATNFIQQMIRVRGEFQQLEVSFKTMLKSKSEADKLLAQAVELAAKTPFQLSDVGAGAKQLLAYGFSADQVIGTLKTLGDVSSGVSAPLGDIVYLYGTLRTQGRAYTRDIMQFTSRGIPIISELAKQFGVTEDKVSELVEAGKVGFPEVEKAFKSMTGQGGLFFNLMEEQSKTLTGQISNLEDAFSQMLNNLGKSQEGLFSGAIQSLTFLVNNYQTVLDIIKVLTVAYGAYRTALIITNALESIRVIQLNLQAAGVSRLTVAELLHYAALEATSRAQKILNATMLSNPYVALATILAGLTTALLIMKDSTLEVKSSQELLAETTKRSGSALTEQETKINAYVTVLQNANSTEQERLVAYQKLRDINPVLVKGINAQSVAQGQLTANVKEYVAALREKFRLEANEAAASESFKQEQLIQERITKLNTQLADISTKDQRRREQYQNAIQYMIGVETKKLEEQKKVTESLISSQIKQEGAKAEAAKKTNAQLIAEAQSLEQIKAIREDIEKAYKASTVEKERLQLTKDLEAADRRIKELDPYGRQKASAKEAQKEVSKLTDLLKDLADAEGEASRSGLVRDENEIARINARYDELVKRAKELQSAGVKVPGAVFTRIESARGTETGNARIKQDVEDYKKVIAAQKDIFKDFQEFQQEVGIEKAQQVYQEQVGNALSFVEFLRNELSKLDGDSSVTASFKRDALANALSAADKEEIQNTLNRYKEVIQATLTYEQQKYIITQKYEKERALLLKNGQLVQAAERDKQYKEDIDRLNDNNIQQLKAYKDLFGDIDELDTSSIKKIIDVWTGPDGMLEQLKKAGKISEEEIKKIKKQLGEAMEEVTGRGIEAFASFISVLRSVSNEFKGINDGLADTIDTMSDVLEAVGGIAAVAGVASNVKTGKFSSDQANNALGTIGGLIGTGAAIGGALTSWTGPGAIIGAAIGAVVGAVAAALKGGKKVRESLQKTYEAQYAFLVNQELGEYRINEVIRQRNLLKAQEIDLTLKGIQAQKQANIENQKQNKAEQERILALLQGEAFISGVDAKKYGGFLGLWRKKQAVNQYSSLMGMTIDQIEKLYAENKLDGRAKTLFEQLQKLQAEGQNIQQMLSDLEQQTKEIFTGTTADSITDAIVDGFANGKFAAQDFAGTFEDLMRQAALNALKYKFLEEPLKAFYDQFAKNAESDGVLTGSEISKLRDLYDKIIAKAGDQFKDLEDITGLNLANGGSGGNSLMAGIQGMSQQTAELIAGQFGGLRITGLQQVQIMNSSLSVLNAIKGDTSYLLSIDSRLRKIENEGIKLKK